MIEATDEACPLQIKDESLNDRLKCGSIIASSYTLVADLASASVFLAIPSAPPERIWS
jgi:hypothetical protein